PVCAPSNNIQARQAGLPASRADDPAVLFYTSGTTGPPKGVPLTHGNIASQLDTVAEMQVMTGADRVLLPLPLHHVYPFVIGMLVVKFLVTSLHELFGERIRLLASGGAALDPELASKLEALGWQVAIGYGLTETSPLLAINLPGKGRSDSVGKPFPGVKIRIDP